MSESKEERKKRLQHEAWERWYKGPKGTAYRQKKKERDATKPEPSLCPNCIDPACKLNGCMAA
jgi:hypothetical protein